MRLILFTKEIVKCEVCCKIEEQILVKFSTSTLMKRFCQCDSI